MSFLTKDQLFTKIDITEEALDFIQSISDIGTCEDCGGHDLKEKMTETFDPSATDSVMGDLTFCEACSTNPWPTRN